MNRTALGKLAGILIPLLGVALALGEKLINGAADHAAGGWSGELAILGAAATGGICSVLYRPYLRRYPTLPVSAFAMAAAAAALLVPAALDDLAVAPFSLPAGARAAIVFIGPSSGGGYLLRLGAPKTLAAARGPVFLAPRPA